jgi:hypothetical protein
MLVIVIKGAIIFTKGFINHYKIYQGQNDPIIFFCYNIITDLHLKARKIMLRKRGSFVFCKTKNNVFTSISYNIGRGASQSF